MNLKLVGDVPDLEKYGDDFSDLADVKSEKREVAEKKHKTIKTFTELQKKYNIPSYDALTEGWFSLRPMLSYNVHLLFAVGMRSAGKSTGVSLWLLMWFLNTQQGWIYCRRDKDEVDETADSWFDNAAAILNEYITEEEDRIEVIYQGGRYHVNGMLAGISVSLKKQQKLKSKNLSWVKWQVYDEAITQDGRGYIGGSADPEKEYDYLMSLRTTADRKIGLAYRDEVVVICLANNESYFNPIFFATGADKYIRNDTHFLHPKGEEWVVQQMREEDSPNAAKFKDTVAYKLASRRMRQRDFENKNDMQVQNSEFIVKITKPIQTYCNLHFRGYHMQMKVDAKAGICYICKGSQEGVPDYALSLPDHRPNYMLIIGKQAGEGYLLHLKTFYRAGMVYYENIKCKMAIDTFFGFIV